MQRVLKKNLTPLTKHGSITTHRGKGATERPLQSGTTMNNYAKATPMAQPMAPSPAGGTDNDTDDFGS